MPTPPTLTSTLGDFFTTRHSSFDRIHAIFHLCGNRNDLNYNAENYSLHDRSPVLCGLTRVLEAANQCGVAKLYVPILLIDEGWQQATANPDIINRVEQVLFCVRSFFLDHTSARGGSLREVYFLAPTVLGEQRFDTQCRGLVRQVFRGDY